ncbi:MAG: hypothetical protein ACR2MP_16110 [Streptosporangiaceae bacterium]
MTSDDLIVVAPWLVFGAGLAVIGYRLLRHRRTPGHLPGGRPVPPEYESDARDAAPAGGCKPSGTQTGSRKQAR